MFSYNIITPILVMVCIASILFLIVPHMLHNMKYGEFRTIPGVLIVHSFPKYKPILIHEITKVEYSIPPRSFGAFWFSIYTSNGNVVKFSIDLHKIAERERLERELRMNGYEGPFLYIPTRVRDKKRLEKVGNLVKNSYLYRWKSIAYKIFERWLPRTKLLKFSV